MRNQLTVKWFVFSLICYGVFSAFLAAKTWQLGKQVGCVIAMIKVTGGHITADEGKLYCKDMEKTNE